MSKKGMSTGRAGKMTQEGISGPNNVKAGKAHYENVPEMSGPVTTINRASTIGGKGNGSVSDPGLMKGSRASRSPDVHKRIVSSDPLRVGVKPVTGK